MGGVGATGEKGHRQGGTATTGTVAGPSGMSLTGRYNEMGRRTPHPSSPPRGEEWLFALRLGDFVSPPGARSKVTGLANSKATFGTGH
jgi:hypothetical protein